MSKKHLAEQAMKTIKSLIKTEDVQAFKNLDILFVSNGSDHHILPGNNIADINLPNQKKSNSRAGRGV